MHVHHRTAAGILVAFLLCAAAATHAATPIVIDNTSPEFSTVGTWPASTNVTGYQGTNYQTHEASGTRVWLRARSTSLPSASAR